MSIDKNVSGIQLPGDARFLAVNGERLNEYTPLSSLSIATNGELYKIYDFAVRKLDEEALLLLLQQYKTSPKVKGFLVSCVRAFNDVANQFQDMFNITNIDKAFGDSLDMIGELVGQPRLGWNDADYRERIKFKIFLNQTSGEPETVIQFAKYLCRASDVIYQEVYPATIYLHVFTGLTLTKQHHAAIKSIMVAGVALNLTSSSTNTKVFSFEHEGIGPVDPLDGGFDEGEFAEYINPE